jgi:hypothetical protein
MHGASFELTIVVCKKNQITTAGNLSLNQDHRNKTKQAQWEFKNPRPG